MHGLEVIIRKIFMIGLDSIIFFLQQTNQHKEIVVLNLPMLEVVHGIQ